jgi:hypothetical protein
MAETWAGKDGLGVGRASSQATAHRIPLRGLQNGKNTRGGSTSTETSMDGTFTSATLRHDGSCGSCHRFCSPYVTENGDSRQQAEKRRERAVQKNDDFLTVVCGSSSGGRRIMRFSPGQSRGRKKPGRWAAGAPDGGFAQGADFPTMAGESQH